MRLALSAGLWLALTSAAGAAPALPDYAARDRVWAQTYSDLPADPDVRFGVLPNGMKYAIRRNATPTGQTSLRLRIGSGSLEETDAEQGLAHFLEHMAFKGSVHVPNGDMIRILQRLGLAFGADTNAQTEFTQTVFQFDLPQSNADSLGTGLMLMREIAGDLTLPAGPMNTERGVVLSEERLRDTPGYEAFKAQWSFIFKGQLIADRQPIGKVAVIQSATPELLRTFYRANYRPDRATLIAVGDFDPAAMEAEIKARYSDWRPVGPETPVPDLGRPLARGTTAELYVEPGTTPAMTLSWTAPFDTAPDTFAHEKHDLIEQVALAALNRRLDRLAHGAQPPFLAAQAGRDNEERSAKIASLRILYRPGGWREALLAAVETQRQALRYGFSPAEVAREITELRLRFSNAAAGAATRRTPALADEIVRSVDDQQVETSPAQDLETFDRAVQGLTPEAVDAALATAFEGSGPLLFASSPEPLAGGKPALEAALEAAETAPVRPPAAVATARWTHTDFGPPGRVVEERRVEDLGVTFVRFVNGVRLAVKPTAFSKDVVQVAVHFGEGRTGLPRDRPSPWWALPAFTSGGLRDLDYDALQQVLADRTVSADLHLEDDSYQLDGTTRPQDLPVQMQLLAAYMTAPGFRSEAFDHRRQMTAVALNELDSTPEGVETRDLAPLEHRDDPRWALPTPAALAASRPDDLKALLEPALTAGPLEVIVVGDTTVQAAVAAVASTFGALPARPPATVPAGGDQVRFPLPSPQAVIRRHDGRADQAIGLVAWPATDEFADQQRSRVLITTAEILASRLIDQVRIAEGATYSPSAHAALSETFPGYGYISGSVETPPGRLAHFYGDVDAITADMAARGVSPDELERARRPHVQGLLKAQQTDEYWVDRLHLADQDPRRLELIRGSVPGYARITPADVQAAARDVLASGRSWRFEVEPQHPSPVAATPTAALPVPRSPEANTLRGPPATPPPKPNTDLPRPPRPSAEPTPPTAG